MRYYLGLLFILISLHFNIFQEDSVPEINRCPAGNYSCLSKIDSIFARKNYAQATQKYYQFRYSHGLKHFKDTHQYVSAINKLIKFEKQIANEYGNLDQDKQAYLRLLLDFKNEPPTPEAIHFMATHSWWTKSLLQIHIYTDLIVSQSFTELFKIISGPYGLLSFAKDQPPFFKSLVRWTYIRTAGVVSMFNPLAIPTRSVNFPDNLISILNKQYRRPSYRPNENELRILDKWQLRDAFIQRQNFMLDRPVFSYWRSRLTTIKEILLGVSALATLNHLREQSSQPILSILEFMQNVPPRDTIQLIVEQIPFPHLSLKIGGQVYTFGQTTLTTLPIQDYYLANLHKRNNQNYYEKLLKQRGYRFNQSIEKFFSEISLGQPHSATVVEVTLTESEVSDLRNYLEQQSLRDYVNWTGINDCATMLARALKEHTSLNLSYLLDASPNQIALQLSTMKSLGDPRIKSIYTIASSEEYRKNYHLYRNALIAYAESSLFTNFFIYLRTARLYLDGYYGKELLQDRSAQAQQLINQWQESAINDLYFGEYVQFDYLLAQSYSKNGANRQSIINVIESLESRIKELEKIKPSDNFYKRMTNLAKIEEAKRLIDLLQERLED